MLPKDDQLDALLEKGLTTSSTAPRPVPTAVQAALQSNEKLPSWRRDAAMLVAVNVLLSGALVAKFSLHVEQYRSLAFMVAGAALLVILMSLGAWVAVRPQWGTARRALTVVIPACAVTMLVGASGNHDIVWGTGCTSTALMISVVPLVTALWTSRRFAFDVTRTVLASAASFACGLLVLHTHCPVGSVLHIALTHLAPWPLVIGGAVLIRRFIRSETVSP
jgi:hypothetical protein